MFEQELGNLTSLLSDSDYNQFGNTLVSNGVISQATMSSVLSTVGASKRDQVERLARAMLNQVKQNIDCFEHLVILMKMEPTMEAFAVKILKTYCESLVA